MSDKNIKTTANSQDISCYSKTKAKEDNCDFSQNKVTDDSYCLSSNNEKAASVQEKELDFECCNIFSYKRPSNEDSSKTKRKTCC